VSSPRRILFFLESLSAGGAQRQTVELIKRLDRARFDPTILVFHGPRNGDSNHFLPDLAQLQVPVRNLDLRWTPVDIAVGFLGVIRAVWRERPAILHCISNRTSHLARLMRPLLPWGLPVITSVRTEYTPRQLFYERCEHVASTRIICNSPHMERTLSQRCHIPLHKLICIPNGVDVARFAANPDPGLRQRIAPGATHTAVMMARIARQKSPHILAAAVGRLKQQGRLPAGFRLFIVGETNSEELQSELTKVVQAHELGQVITQISQTTAPESFYHLADFTVLASLWEGMPNVVIESLAAGRPVIVSEAANASGLIQENVNGWIVPTNDIDGLSDKLGLVLSMSPEEIRSLAPACARRAADFSLTRMVDRYQDIYLQLLN